MGRQVYTDEQHELMYRPIDDELERLRAFKLDVLNLVAHGFQDVDTHYLKAILEKHGVAA